jgi:PKD repeat protein
MKKLLLFKKFIIVILLAGISLAGWAQVLLYEDFNYATPAYIGGNGAAGTSSNNWTTHSVTAGQTTTIDITDGSLTYPGLVSSTGNMVNFFSNANATSRDINRSLTTTATVCYYSALIKVLDATQLSGTTVDYFMSFGGSAGTSVTSLAGRLGIKSVNTAANYRLYVGNNSGGTGNPVYTEFAQDLDYGTTYLIVIKLDRSASPVVASLWINPTNIGGTEPSGSVSNATGTNTFTAFASICIRNSATTPKANIDEIRVGQTWADVTPAGAVTPTITVTSPSAGAQWAQGSTHNITWTATGTNTNVKIEYTGNASDATPTWVTINDTETTPASAGTYAAQVPVDLPVSADSKIRISDIPETVSAMSDIFSIIAAPQPVATFLPADAATGIAIASDITITFDVPVRNIDDSDITDSNVASLLTLTTTDATGTAVPFTTTIDATKKVITINPDADLTNEQLYYVSIAPVEGLSNNATTAQHITFTTAASLAPSISDVTITEVAPYTAGDFVTINWVSNNITDVQIEAWIPSGNKWEVIIPTTPSDGSEIFQIPVDAQYSTDYKIRVSDIATPTVSAESTTFTIIGAISEVSITEVAPYFAGDEITVKWVAKNISTVKIELLDPVALTWSELATSVPAADGSKKVSLPTSLLTNTAYKVKVTNETNNTGLESAAFEAIAVAKDLITLRAQPAGVKIKFTGIATITYARTTRNQKYIQDATAAILIDDPNPGFITGTYQIGDGITNIVGKNFLYNDLIEFVPISNGVPAIGTPIIPEVRTLASLTPADQCKLVKIENFAFKTPNQYDPDGKFPTTGSKNFDIEGTDNTLMAFRSGFLEADYIGGYVPVGTITSVVLVGQFKAQMQITARSWADMTIPVVADFMADQTFVLTGENVNFMDMSSNHPTGWEWTFEGGTPATSTDQNPVVTYSAKGNYAVTLKATHPSGGTNTITKTDYISIGVVGISTLQSTVKVYPNPTNDFVYITNPTKDAQEIVIFNAVGKQVSSTRSSKDVISLNIASQSKGMYLVRITNTATKSVQFKKVVLY